MTAFLSLMTKGIVIVTLPPHTTDKLQPLDASVYASFKSCMRTIFNSYTLMHPHKHITEHMLPEFAPKAWVKACTPSNVLSGFSATGIWPINPDIFPDAAFLTSEVTEKPVPPAEDTDGVDEGVGSIMVSLVTAGPSPGPSVPSSSTPGSYFPGSSAPGPSSPGSYVPGPSALTSFVPGSSVPGSSTPGPSSQGSSVPGPSVPGSSTPAHLFLAHRLLAHLFLVHLLLAHLFLAHMLMAHLFPAHLFLAHLLKVHLLRTHLLLTNLLLAHLLLTNLLLSHL